MAKLRPGVLFGPMTGGVTGGAYPSVTEGVASVQSRTDRRSQGPQPEGSYPTRWQMADAEWGMLPPEWRAAWAERGSRHHQSGYSHFKGGYLTGVDAALGDGDWVLSLARRRWIPAPVELDTHCSLLLGHIDDRPPSAFHSPKPLSFVMSGLLQPAAAPACNPPGRPLPTVCHGLALDGWHSSVSPGEAEARPSACFAWSVAGAAPFANLELVWAGLVDGRVTRAARVVAVSPGLAWISPVPNAQRQLNQFVVGHLRSGRVLACHPARPHRVCCYCPCACEVTLSIRGTGSGAIVTGDFTWDPAWCTRSCRVTCGVETVIDSAGSEGGLIFERHVVVSGSVTVPCKRGRAAASCQYGGSEEVLVRFSAGPARFPHATDCRHSQMVPVADYGPTRIGADVAPWPDR